MKLLVIRNDKLGDFMLSYPAYAMLKLNLSDCEVHALVPSYTKDMALESAWIDKVIVDPGKSATLQDTINLLQQIRAEKYAAVITLFSTTRIGLITCLARIPIRIAPATKLAQIFYNSRIKQRRSQSLKPEYEYNLDLISSFLHSKGIESPIRPKTPFLSYPKNDIKRLRSSFLSAAGIADTTKLVFIHSGSGGSANNLSLSQYSELALTLHQLTPLTAVLTAGPGEEENALALSAMLKDKVPHIVYQSKKGLVNFTRHIAFADLFISSSTGPLHIAGALDIPTAAFYTRRQSATPLRWQTLNSEHNRLAFTPPEDSEETDMSKINITTAAKTINKKYLA